MKRRDGKPWQRLVEYALACVKSESAQTWVPLETGPEDNPWSCLDGPETLITGRADSATAATAIAEYLDQTRGSIASRRNSLIYGWPSVVSIRADTGAVPRRQITPLFVVQVEPTKRDGQWQLTPSHEPEFNLAALANRPENADTADEIRKLPLPFGDPEETAQTATKVAKLLGYSPPVLDPDQLVRLDQATAREAGVHNASICLVAAFSPHRVVVDKELRALHGRGDWVGTAAAWLVGKGKEARRTPSEPLVAALRTNQSQEEILASIRTQPLTVVTGPPGTGKTQLVVNAVANAWLDGETVLVASTNNAAVDIAVERSDRDALPGLLIRTGHRHIKQQVAQSISIARTNARRYAGPRRETARRLFAKVGKQRSVRRTEIEQLENMDEWLLRKIEERSEAHNDLLEATGRLIPVGKPSAERAEDESPSLEEVRIRARAAGAKLKMAYDRQCAAPRFVPTNPTQPELETRTGLVAEEVKEIRRRAAALIGSGLLFAYFARKKLREDVGCPRDTRVEDIHKWTRAWQEVEAERLREEEYTRAKEMLAQQTSEARRGLAEAFGREDEATSWRSFLVGHERRTG